MAHGLAIGDDIIHNSHLSHVQMWLLHINRILLFLYIKMILYILRRFKKLVITYFTSKNTLNLINLFLFLKKRNKVKMVNQQK